MLQVTTGTFGDLSLEISIAEARNYFDTFYPRSLSPNSKIVPNLLAHFFRILIDYYEIFSNYFLSRVSTLGQAISGDQKKLWHFTGNSGHIIAVKAKPARVGLWFNQLVGCLEKRSPLNLI